MLSKTAKTLVLLFSGAIVISGCSQKEIPAPIVVNRCPVIQYSKIDTSKKITLNGKVKNGNVVLSKKDFKKLTAQYLRMKGQVEMLQSILDSYNSYAKTQTK